MLVLSLTLKSQHPKSIFERKALQAVYIKNVPGFSHCEMRRRNDIVKTKQPFYGASIKTVWKTYEGLVITDEEHDITGVYVQIEPDFISQNKMLSIVIKQKL